MATDSRTVALGFMEDDWKLFKRQIRVWQESCMEGLIREYAALLSGSEAASEKFWELERRIKRDRRRTGVICEMRRSCMNQNVVELIHEGVIILDELEGFSDAFRESVERAVKVVS